MNDDCSTQRRKCFIITPVGDDSSEIRRLADGVIAACIKPVLEKLNFECEAPHELVGAGSITKDVIEKIVNNDLVIANLTKLNPNVMYELGIRHSARKPIVHICEKGTILPFDIAPERTLFYVNDMKGAEELKPKLESFIESVLGEAEINNPVYDAIQRKSIMEKLTETDPLKYIMSELTDIKDRLDYKNTNIGNDIKKNFIKTFRFDMLIMDDSLWDDEKNITSVYMQYFNDFMKSHNITHKGSACGSNKKDHRLNFSINIDKSVDNSVVNDNIVNNVINKFIEKYQQT